MKKLILLTIVLCGCDPTRVVPSQATHVIYEKTNDGEKVWTGGNVYHHANYVSFNEVGSARTIHIYGQVRTLELQ